MKIRILMLASLLHLALFIPLAAQTANTGKLEKAKASAQSLSTDAKNTAEVTMNSGAKIKGRITSVGGDSFSIQDTKSGSSQTISFADVDQIKKSRKGLSTAAWIAIGAGAAAAIIVGAIVGRRYCNEQAC